MKPDWTQYDVCTTHYSFKATRLEQNPTILGDPRAVNRVGRKNVTKVFKYGRKSPWVPTVTELFPKFKRMLAPDWAPKMLCIILPLVLFVSSYTTAIVSITACLVQCTQSGDFKILSARKIKTFFQKYELELTKGSLACIGQVSRKY